MYKRESEIHFSPWLSQEKEQNWFNLIIISVVFHVLFFFILNSIKEKPEISNAQNPSSIKINISNLLTNKKPNTKDIVLPKTKNHKKILTDSHLDSKSPFASLKQEKDPPPTTNQKEKNLNSFLPNANPDFANEYRQQNQIPKNIIQGDDGDIPIEGPSLAPTNEPRVISRFSEKDMSLFQFTQEFRERFGAVWNSEDRIVPPTSPLKPGDIVYYKVYINSNGHLEKFENLSHLKNPNKNYEDVDVLFSSVISHVFPMSVPPKFANKNLTLTEIIAIQVVDRSMPARFSF